MVTTAKAKPTVKKPAPAEKPKTAPKKVAKKASPATAATVATAGISPDQRRHYVEMAAFYIAERRNFAPGNPMDDWLAAEAEIDRLLAAGHIG